MEIGFHGDKNLIKVIEKSVENTDFFIELGTRKGRSLNYISDQFPEKKFRSCEINDDFYKEAKLKFEDKRNVRIFPMDSCSFLESFWVHWYTMEDPKKLSFWVDLTTHNDVDYLSPFREIEEITKRFNDALIFVDDVKVPFHSDWFQYNSLDKELTLNNIKERVEWEEYTLIFPDYKEEFNEMYHPPVGWCLIVKDKEVASSFTSDFPNILRSYTFPSKIDKELNLLLDKNKFEFATTACVRPELLDETYSSLNECIVDLDMRESGILYINIDPVPYSSKEKIEEELEVAKKHFSEVYYNVGPEGGSFPKAAKWVFSQPEGKYFFHIEDDWVFDGIIPIKEYIEKIEKDDRENMLQCVTYQNGGGNRIHFPPSVYKTETLRQILDEHPIRPDKNPEEHLIALKKQGVVDYNVTSHGGVDREDIGRDWQKEKGVQRNFTGNNLSGFTDWDLSNFNG